MGGPFSIARVWALEVLDSRGNPTLRAYVRTEGGVVGSFSVPAGASRGRYEAVELRDGGKRLGGKGVLKAIASVERAIADAIVGMDVRDQRGIDTKMIEVDGTENKRRLGGNATLAVSGACARAASQQLGVPLYRYIGGMNAHVMPVPLMNVLNGGVHAGNELSIQEFMIVPAKFGSFREALFAGVEVYHELRALLRERYGKTAINLGDEGGFAPPMKRTKEALDALRESIERAGYDGRVLIAIDAAASGFYKGGRYSIDGRELSPSELANFYEEIVEEYDIISIEDPFHEEDFESLAEITRRLGDRVQIVGDDYFTTNVTRLARGVEAGAGNALLLKPNQIGTLTESMEAAALAFRSGYGVIVSHRSGETEDPFIADLAVALNCGQIKTGAPARGERTAKYNRLLEIEEELGRRVEFPGVETFRRAPRRAPA
ncbi:MAG: phosphopyruvate hydratase [Thermoproteota archaeon]|nr:MAG: phosphopyruvate hydratase [Candidatus Korarchaeota archaeon]